TRSRERGPPQLLPGAGIEHVEVAVLPTGRGAAARVAPQPAMTPGRREGLVSVTGLVASRESCARQSSGSSNHHRRPIPGDPHPGPGEQYRHFFESLSFSSQMFTRLIDRKSNV